MTAHSNLRRPAARSADAGDVAPSSAAAAAAAAAASRLRWPLPALLCWGLCWVAFHLLRPLSGPALAALLVTFLGLAIARTQRGRWRQGIVAGGFPLSLLLVSAAHGGGLPAIGWLVPAVLLAVLYPAHAWRDAPWYPTGRQALAGLAATAALPPGARVLDAGCGVGHGLAELRREYPGARLAGIEWSLALTVLARLRCPWAAIHRGDLWADDWADYDLVYLFQRPESMPRAVEKARTQMRPGSVLVSLAFEAPDLRPMAVLRPDGSRPVWIYRIGERAASGNGRRLSLKSSAPRADMQNNTSGAGRPRSAGSKA